MSHSMLLVEDDADDRYIMHLAFAERAFTEQVKVFNSGEEFLRYLTNLPHESLYPALIVLDYNMPGMNGGEVLMRLKQNAAFREIPVAMYSTGMRSMEQKIKALGADYCFEKGQHVSEITALVEQLKNIVEGHAIVKQ